MTVFFDTNVLVYAVDVEESDKSVVARELVERHLVEGDGLISVQVLREFYAASRKMKNPIPAEQAEEMVGYFSAFAPMPEDVWTVLGAVRRSRALTLSFWDALIVESALRGGADRLLTEDLQNGQIIEGMRIENPFL